MSKLVALLLSLAALSAADLPSKKYLNLSAIKTMVAAAEAEADKRNVQVSICIVDDSGNFLFFERRDGASLSTIEFAQRKARDAAFYKSASKAQADQLKGGNLAILALPGAFPNQGGLPVKVDGQTLGGIAVSGAKSEVDEAIAQAGLDALMKQ
jgi:glc operon protein GlcG